MITSEVQFVTNNYGNVISVTGGEIANIFKDYKYENGLSHKYTLNSGTIIKGSLYKMYSNFIFKKL